nr:hypothetical protein [Paludisphaera mucosa]
MPRTVLFRDYTVTADPPGVPSPIPVPGGAASVKSLDVRQGAFTFDFATGTGPQGSLAVGESFTVGRAKPDGGDVSASLVVTGGRLSQSESQNWAGGVVGEGLHATGRLVADGAGAQISLARDLWVGNGGGTGYVEALGGGVIQARSIVSGPYGGPSGELTTAYLRADGAGSQIIGFSGLNNGGLTVTNGGYVNSQQGDGTYPFTFLGTIDGGRATALVDGPGSRWDHMAALWVGGVYHTNTSARGELTIRNGGEVESGFVVVGDRYATGSVDVQGAGSTLRSGDMFVGIGKGTGSLSASGGGEIEGAGIYVGSGLGSGAISASDGGEIHGVAVVLGNDGDSTGAADVRSGGRLVSDHELVVGQAGGGTMLVKDAGVVQSDEGIIARLSGSSGTATIQGEGSRWDVGSNLSLGGHAASGSGGEGLLTVQDGGLVTVGARLDAWDQGTIEVLKNGRLLIGSGDAEAVSPGTLEVGYGGVLAGTGTILGDVVNAGGVIAPGHSPGLLSIDGGLFLGAAGTLHLEIGGASPGMYDTLSATGRVSLGGLLILDFLDGYTPDDGLTLSLITAGTGFSGSFREIQTRNYGSGPIQAEFAGGVFSVRFGPAAAVPEPAGVLLGLIGLACVPLVGAIGRPRRGASASPSPTSPDAASGAGTNVSSSRPHGVRKS